MHLTHLIIDDFFADPDEIRKQALNSHFPVRPEKANYPGRNAAAPLSFPGIEKFISRIVHEPLIPKPGSAHGYPRLALEGDESRANIHVDMNHWSAIIYLSLDEDCRGGTHFYRHIPTGWEMVPTSTEIAKQAGYDTPLDALNDVLTPRGYDEENWELRMTVPMKYNRMVLLRGYLFHDAGVSFGDKPENGRLILPFFFNNTDQQ